MSDYFDLFVNNELEEVALTEDEVQDLTAEIMEDYPGAVITIEPTMDEDELPDDLEDDFYDEDEDEDEEDSEE